MELSHVVAQVRLQRCADSFRCLQALLQRGLQILHGTRCFLGAQLAKASRWIAWIPFRRHSQHLIVQPRGSMPIEREASQHDQLGGVVARAQHSGAAERIGLEAPHQEAIEQAHHQRVLQVQMHPIGIHFLRIAEHHRLQLGVLPPLLSVLPRLQRRPQRIEHIPPGCFAAW